MKQMKTILALLAMLVSVSASAKDDPLLVTATNTNLIRITAGFTGQELLVFGAISHPGEVVVKVTSPNETTDLRRKVQLGPFWLTGGNMRIENTPGVFNLLSSAPLNKIMSADEMAANGMVMKDMLNNAKFANVPANMSDWRSALLRLRKNHGYYVEDGSAVNKINDRLFVTHINLPANLPQGTYKLDTYLVDGGKVIAHQQRKFDMAEVQLEGWVSRLAYEHSWLFGIGFTFIAMFGGLGLGIILRRDSDS